MNKVAAPRDKAILVVDDEKNIRFTVVHALKSDLFNVDSASSGVEGLQKCGAKRYDLILVDLRMPGMTGLEMLSEIRRDGTEVPPAVIITAHGMAGELFEAASLGAIDYVRKPFSISSIRSAVREVLERFDTDAGAEDRRELRDLLMRAKHRLMLREYDDARSLLEAAAGLDPTSSEAYSLLGLGDLLQDRQSEAIMHFRYALYVDPACRMATDYLAWLSPASDA
jgi:DNA-binding response OmpR family regulator